MLLAPDAAVPSVSAADSATDPAAAAVTAAAEEQKAVCDRARRAAEEAVGSGMFQD